MKSILTHMTNPSSATALSLNSTGERLAVIVNNLGGTSKLEELVGMSSFRFYENCWCYQERQLTADVTTCRDDVLNYHHYHWRSSITIIIIGCTQLSSLLLAVLDCHHYYWLSSIIEQVVAREVVTQLEGL